MKTTEASKSKKLGIVSDSLTKKALRFYKLSTAYVSDVSSRLSSLLKKKFRALRQKIHMGGDPVLPMDYFSGVANPVYKPVQSFTDMSATHVVARPALTPQVGGGNFISQHRLSKYDVKKSLSANALKYMAVELNNEMHTYMSQLSEHTRNEDRKVSKAAIKKAYAQMKK